VHLLVYNDWWIFKMHGATIKIVRASLYCFTLNLKAPRRYLLARWQCSVPEILNLRHWTSSQRSLHFECWCSVRAVWFAILRPQTESHGWRADTARGFSISAFCCVQLRTPLACGSHTKGLAFSESHHVVVAIKILVYGRRREVECRVLEEGWHDISRNLFACRQRRKTGSDTEMGKRTRGLVHC
jgi:hypothetical protein